MGLSPQIDMQWRRRICPHGKADRMKSGYPYDRLGFVARLMAGIGSLGAAALILLRVWVLPAQRDIDTGLFAPNTLVVALSCVMLAMLGALVFIMRGGPRREIAGKPALTLSVVLLIVGAAMILLGGLDLWTAFRNPAAAEESVIVAVLPWLQTAFCMAGGAAFLRLGLLLASEGGIRRGMAQWSLLLPVLWSWFVLANYEISPDSMVRITDGGFFNLAMYIMEMLFLFRFASYVAGVGRNGVGSVLFFSAGTAVFALSGPLVRLLLYLLQDVEAASAAGAAGLPDLLVGVLALTVSITLCQSLSAPAEESSADEADGAVWADDSDVLPDVELVEVVDAEEEDSEELPDIELIEVSDDEDSAK